MRLVVTLFFLVSIVAAGIYGRHLWRVAAYTSINVGCKEMDVVKIMGSPTYVDVNKSKPTYGKRDLSVCRDTCARRLWYEDGPLGLIYGVYVFDFDAQGRIIYKGQMYSP